MILVRRLRRWLGWIVAAGLIGAAVVLTLLRLALPFAGEYRAAVEARVEAYLDVPVTIGDMAVEWHRLGPRLRLVDLRLSGPPPANAPVHFAEAWVDLGFAPARELPLRIRSLSLVGLEVDVRLNERGDLSLFGFTVPPEKLIPHPERTPPPMVRQALRWLSGIERLQVLDAAITITDAQGVQTRLPAIDLRLQNDGREHRASASIALPSAWGEHIRAVVAMRGAVEDWPRSSGRAWVEGTALELARFGSLRDRGAVRLEGGRGDLSAWLDWSEGRLTEVLAEGRFDGLALAAANGDPAGDSPAARKSTVQFDRLGGRVRWARTAAGDWQLDAGGLQVRRNGRAWPDGGITVAHERSAGLSRWHFGADFLRLEDVGGLARVLPLAADVAERLDALGLRGDLSAFRAAGAGPERFYLRGRFADLGWRPAKALPGVTGVDGHAAFGAGGGRIALATTQATLSAPRLFTGELSLSELHGGIDFVRDGDGARVDAPDLRFANTDGSGRARIGVDVPRQGEVQLDIGASVTGVDLAAVPDYLPDRMLDGGVVRGLDRALQAGRVVRGSLRLRGPAAGFPYAESGAESGAAGAGAGGDGAGVFRIEADIRDAAVAFAPDWPALEGMGGVLRIDGPALRIAAEEGRLLGVGINRLDARIGDLRDGVLEVSSLARASLDELLQLIEASPLAQRTGAFLEGAAVHGTAPIALELDVPLREPEATRVAGRLQLAGAEFNQPRYDLDLRQLDGTLRFSERGLETDGLRAQVRGRPVTIRASLGEDYDTILATGRLGLAQLVPDLPRGLARRFDGAAPWRLQLRLPTGAGTAMLAGVSDLRGTAVDLPAPLGKSAATARRLAFSLPLAPSGRTLRLDYGDDVRALLGFGGASGAPPLERATLHFGAGPVRLPEQPGAVVSGRVDRLDLGGWARLLHAAGADGGASGDASRPGLRRLDLEAGAAVGAGHILSAVRVRAVPVEAGGWSVDLESTEVDGRMRIPAQAGSGEPVRLRFDLIDFALLRPVEATASAPRAAPEPGTLPPFDIRVARLKTREATLEQVRVVTAPTRNGLNIHRLEFTNPHLALEGQGRWRGGIDPRTALRLTVRSDNLGQGLAGIGYPGAFVDGEGRVTVDLAWPGPPWQASVAALSGHADLELADGLIPELDPGPARLLGLFSLRALPQMLSLNLQGLLRAGYAFDEITGRVDFANGQAYTRNLVVDGPPGKMIISGRTGLVEQDYDQLIAFQPELSSSLPLIGALSGGPVTGLAVALIQGVLRNVGADAEKASELRYRLTGPWADPKVRRVNAPRSAPAEPSGSGKPRGR